MGGDIFGESEQYIRYIRIVGNEEKGVGVENNDYQGEEGHGSLGGLGNFNVARFPLERID